MNNEITTTAKKPWEQQNGEDSTQYLAFNIYLDLSDKRSFRKTASLANISLRNIFNWAKKWCWKERASAYDNNLIEEKRKIFWKEFKNSGKNHSDNIKKISLIYHKLIELINNKTVEELNQMSEMKLPELLKLIKSIDNVLPSLSENAASNLNLIKKEKEEPGNSLELGKIMQRRPELISDVTDLLSKITQENYENVTD